MLPQTTNGVGVTRDIVQLRLLLQLDEEAGVIDVVAADYDNFPTGASSDGASMGQNKKFLLWSAVFQFDRTGDLMSAIPADDTVDHPWPASILYRHDLAASTYDHRDSQVRYGFTLSEETWFAFYESEDGIDTSRIFPFLLKLYGDIAEHVVAIGIEERCLEGRKRERKP